MHSVEVVTTALNEELCLPEFFTRVSKAFELIPDVHWSITVCDNGSSDATWAVISDFAKRDGRIKGIRLSRNFGADASLTCAIDNSTADAIIIMASDLQDPPELIPEMLRRLESGVDQVLVRVVKRDSVPFLYRKLSQAFYQLANKMTNGLLMRNVSDFKLLKRPVYESVRQLREQNRFLRGLVAWTGFSFDVIEIERPPRFGGESKFLQFGFRKAIHWALKAILAHTSAPLTWISLLGLLSSAASFALTIIFSALWIIFGVPFAGFGTIVGVITLGFSLILLCLGIMAQYLALIYEEVKQRPLYLIAERTSDLGA